MGIRVPGKKRKVRANFEKIVAAVSSGAQFSQSGDHEAALTRYVDAIDSLRSDWCRQSLAEGLIADPEWNDQLVAAILGKTRAVASLDSRPVVYEQAEQMMADVFSLRPDWSEAHLFMGELALSRGYTRQALSHVNLVLSTNPRQEGARFLLAVSDFNERQYERALSRLEGLPESPASMCVQARCHLRAGMAGLATEVLERARAQYGDSFETCYYLGCALARAGDPDKALQVFLVARQLDSRHDGPPTQAGIVNLIQGRLAEAETCFKDSINLGGRQSPTAYYGLALASQAAGSIEQLKLHLDSISRIGPDSDVLHCFLGDLHEREGRWTEAVQVYARVDKDSALAGAARARIALMLYRAAQFEPAKRMLNEATSLCPGDRRLLDLLAATAAISGDYQLAIRVWSELYVDQGRDEKARRALRQARLGAIISEVNDGLLKEAAEELEVFCKESGDPLLARALAELYFAYAVDLLGSDVARARESLLLGKHLTGHVKFDYCLALADIVEGRYEGAASRLRGVLAANAKNPGASYHLGLALLLGGDPRGAETALRHGVAISFNSPSRLSRVKWALAALLIGEKKWAEAAAALEGYVPGDEPDSCPSPNEVLDLRIRALAMAGDWADAEKLVLSTPRRKHTAIAALVLVRRNIRNGRPSAAVLQAEKFLKVSQGDHSARSDLLTRLQRALAEIALKTSAEQVIKLHFRQAEARLTRALSEIPKVPDLAAQRKALREFLDSLDFDAEDPHRAHRVAESHSSILIEFDLTEDELRPARPDVGVIMPPKVMLPSDLLPPPVFNPDDWDASPYPDPLIVFDS